MWGKLNNFVLQVAIPSSSFTLDIPSDVGIFRNGFLSTIAFFVEIFFTFMVLIWVGLILYSAYNIMRGYNNQDASEKGIKTIRNILVGITVYMLFVISVSGIGSYIGFGSVYSWSDNFKQCAGAYSSFLFREREEAKRLLSSGTVTYSSYDIYCCEESFSALGISEDPGWAVIGDTAVGGAVYASFCDLEETVSL